MPDWMYWLREIDSAVKRGEPAQQWFDQQWDKLVADLRGKGLSEADKQRIVDQLQQAADYYAEIKRRGFNVAQPMKYESQLMIVIDEDLSDNARDLQRKRELAGEANKSTIFFPQRRSFEPSLPAGQEWPRLGPGSRLYVFGHGTPNSSSIGRVAQWNAPTLARVLKLVMQNCGTSRVRRVSLCMCWGGGNPTGREIPAAAAGGGIQAMESFAKLLFDAMKDATDDVVGRTEEANVRNLRLRNTAGDEEIAAVKKVTGPPGSGELHQGHQRKVIFSADQTGKTQHRYAY